MMFGFNVLVGNKKTQAHSTFVDIMSNYHRAKLGGGRYFFTVVTYRDNDK